MARSGVDTLEISSQNLNNLHLASRAVAFAEPVAQTGLENPDILGYLLDRLFPARTSQNRRIGIFKRSRSARKEPA